MVYRAFDRELGETVAIKVLRPDVARESGRVEHRFRSEIRLARRVRHRNVCSVYGDGEDRGLLYICMELVEGENLARAAREGGGLPPAEAWSAVLQVAEGLSAIHEVGVVHRDLKTANLMRDRDGVVRVMDFGIAKQHGAAGGGATVTATGTLMGTPEYMSPEQLRGEEVDFRSDLYSLGIVVYELFSGALPFRGDTPVDDHRQAAPRRPLPRPAGAAGAAAAGAGPGPRQGPRRPLRHGGGDARRPGRGMPSFRPGRLDPARASPRRPGRRDAAGGPGAAAGGGSPPADGGGPGGCRGARRPPGERGGDSARGDSGAPARRRARLVPHARAHAVGRRTDARGHGPGRGRPAGRPPRARRRFPTPMPPGTAALPDVEAAAPAPLPATRAVDTSHVYDEDEVDVKPRRLAGMTAPYPEWGPKLPRGRSVSITASYVVTEEGLVTDIRVERGGGVLEAVLLEISRWKFEPGTIDGVPVKVRVHWKHTFIGG